MSILENDAQARVMITTTGEMLASYTVMLPSLVSEIALALGTSKAKLNGAACVVIARLACKPLDFTSIPAVSQFIKTRGAEIDAALSSAKDETKNKDELAKAVPMMEKHFYALQEGIQYILHFAAQDPSIVLRLSKTHVKIAAELLAIRNLGELVDFIETPFHELRALIKAKIAGTIDIAMATLSANEEHPQ